jgi:hypothetical protein
MEKIEKEGLKSYNIRKMFGDINYPIFDISSYKMRTYMKSDYLSLVEYYNESREDKI